MFGFILIPELQSGSAQKHRWVIACMWPGEKKTFFLRKSVCIFREKGYGWNKNTLSSKTCGIVKEIKKFKNLKKIMFMLKISKTQ